MNHTTTAAMIPRGIDSMPRAEQRRALEQVAGLVAAHLREWHDGVGTIRQLTDELPRRYGLSKQEVVYGVQFGLLEDILHSDSSSSPIRATGGKPISH